jgi:hypothetical protein
MKGPLQTVLRNLTSKTLSYGTNVSVRPNGESIYPFDPFTEWRDNPSINLERILVDVRQGKVLITYLYDPSFAGATPAPSVKLSLASQRLLAAPQTPEIVPVHKPAEPVKMEGALPPGVLPDDPKIEREKITKDSRPEQRLMQAAAEAAGITAEPEEAKTEERVEEALKEQNLHRQPDPTTDKVKEEVKPETTKRGRRKKEVVTL